MRTVIISISLCVSQWVRGQTEQPALQRIDSIAKRIDTMKGLRQTIAEGTVQPKGKKKPKGGFSDWYCVDTTLKQLVKVIHEQSLYHYDVDAYYFHNDSLVLVVTYRRGNNGNSATSSGRYYFQNDELIYRQEKNQFISYPGAFLEAARSYLAHRKTLVYPFQ